MRNFLKRYKESLETLNSIRKEAAKIDKENAKLEEEIAKLSAKLNANFNAYINAIQKGEDTSKLKEEFEILRQEVTKLKEKSTTATKKSFSKLEELKKSSEQIIL